MSRERDRPSSRSSRQQDLLVKLRGIPSNSTKDNVKKFLHPCRVVNVHFFINNGQATNECFVDLDSDRDLREALRNHKTSMDRRTVEVVRATSHEFKFFVKHKGSKSWRDPVLRLDGLPISCTMADIQNFFKGIEIATNGIYISRDMSDNASGGGYVAFVDMDNAYKAADLFDREHLQDSRIDLTPSTYEEAKETILKDARRNGKRFADEPEDEEEKVDEKKPAKEDQTPRKEHREPAAKRRRSSSPSPRVPARPEKRPARRSRSPVRRSSPKPNRQGEFVVKMRGMPFTVKESDVTKFFPSSCRPVRIEIIHDRRTERPNGDGFAYFTSRDDAYEAMKCHRKYMGKRYIELYLESSPQPKRSRSPRKSASRSPQKSASRSPIETDNRDEEPEAVEREENEEADERAEVEEEEEQEEEREQREERDGEDENDDERSPSSESEH